MATELEVIDYALMAGASYISTRKSLNRFPVPIASGWSELEDKRSGSEVGFEATAFTKGSNQLVISFAGTYDKDIAGDVAADVGLATGVGSIQLLQAAKYYLDLKNSTQYENYNITLTGHSLGGGLAALVGVFFGVSTIAFDQAPHKRGQLRIPFGATMPRRPRVLLADYPLHFVQRGINQASCATLRSCSRSFKNREAGLPF